MIRIHENQANSTSKTNPAPSSHEPQKRSGIRELGRLGASSVCATMARLRGPERRRKAGLMLPQTLRLRQYAPQPQRHGFDELLPPPNTARDSVYFASMN